MRYVFVVDASKLGLVNKERARMFAREVGQAFARCSARAVEELKDRTVQAGKVDLGLLAASWEGKVGDVPGGVHAVLSNSAPHHPYVELGRRAGGAMPPVDKLSAWCGRKLGDPTLGYVVARAIARRGIPPTPIMTSQDFQRRARESFAKGLQDASDRVAAAAVGRVG